MISTRKCKTYYVRKTLYCCSRSFWIFCFSSRCSKLGPAQAFYFQKSLFLPNIPRNIIQCQWYFSIFKGRTFLVSLSWFQIYSRKFVARKPSISSLFNPVFSIAEMHTAYNAICQTFWDISEIFVVESLHLLEVSWLRWLFVDHLISSHTYLH